MKQACRLFRISTSTGEQTMPRVTYGVTFVQVT